ncbi:MAG: hypothetical protein QOI07_3744 [Verrucomicrobiota bacterium]|jgi:SAM-dependent methyltransferase
MSSDKSDQLDFTTRLNCPICEGHSIKLGCKRGRYIQREFSLRECLNCTYTFIENPCVSFDRIYDENYYRAKGADPLTNYVFEFEHPDISIRVHEFRGIIESVGSVVGALADKSWLDFGSGGGGLVRHLNAVAPEAKFVAGFDEGWMADEARRHGIAILRNSELDDLHGSFDVVSAIEVLEHVLDPVETLSSIRKLLKPGGLFYYTTGNSAPFRKNMLEWSYVTPEIHVGFFNPKSVSAALERAGFEVQPALYTPGFDKIIKFKILKNLGFWRDSWIFDLVPWSAVSKLVDMKYRLSDLPLAVAR